MLRIIIASLSSMILILGCNQSASELEANDPVMQLSNVGPQSSVDTRMSNSAKKSSLHSGDVAAALSAGTSVIQVTHPVYSAIAMVQAVEQTVTMISQTAIDSGLAGNGIGVEEHSPLPECMTLTLNNSGSSGTLILEGCETDAGILNGGGVVALNDGLIVSVGIVTQTPMELSFDLALDWGKTYNWTAPIVTLTDLHAAVMGKRPSDNMVLTAESLGVELGSMTRISIADKSLRIQWSDGRTMALGAELDIAGEFFRKGTVWGQLVDLDGNMLTITNGTIVGNDVQTGVNLAVQGNLDDIAVKAHSLALNCELGGECLGTLQAEMTVGDVTMDTQDGATLKGTAADLLISGAMTVVDNAIEADGTATSVQIQEGHTYPCNGELSLVWDTTLMENMRLSITETLSFGLQTPLTGNVLVHRQERKDDLNGQNIETRDVYLCRNLTTQQDEIIEQGTLCN